MLILYSYTILQGENLCLQGAKTEDQGSYQLATGSFHWLVSYMDDTHTYCSGSYAAAT